MPPMHPSGWPIAILWPSIFTKACPPGFDSLRSHGLILLKSIVASHLTYVTSPPHNKKRKPCPPSRSFGSQWPRARAFPDMTLGGSWSDTWSNESIGKGSNRGFKGYDKKDRRDMTTLLSVVYESKEVSKHFSS
ncbi:hypothetical protein O6H91_10G018100 [Diphasiastrum complanatum]|uniref:Uncharacterized protein n=1 Tax=Diphasiastrum complanatum TaxID=34168 RepID=A0ACC2CEM9_DIPCM|nr:hypothetical protein O6H91_10G018100 [Diphasiastrum complanatum]